MTPTLKITPQNPTEIPPTVQPTPSRSHHRPIFTWAAGTYNITLGLRTQVMGILNVTPDSFSQDGLLTSSDYIAQALSKAEQMIEEGADILDIGGESSRPGAEEISVDEEKRRVLPVVEALAKKISIPISIDTHKSEVAQAAMDAGASIVNTIKGAQLTEEFLNCMTQTQAGFCLMHMYGSPEEMQEIYSYDDCVSEICQELKNSLEKCLEKGINSDRIIIDPGIGFGKSVEHNLQLINQIPQFAKLEKPILLGTSRKSFIGHILERDVDKRLYGSLASVCAGIMRGAHVVRVHDVRATREAIDIVDAILNEGLM